MAKLAEGRSLPGKLFIVEGIDGSGKSTQLDILRNWLIGQGYCAAFSEWNSSPIVRNTAKRGKKRQLVTSTSSCLIHAGDSADRIQRQMLPALKADTIVLADCYAYTAFARDVARAVHPEWVRQVCGFPINRPTLSTFACRLRDRSAGSSKVVSSSSTTMHDWI
jgi:dTMP kinase